MSPLVVLTDTPRRAPSASTLPLTVRTPSESDEPRTTTSPLVEVAMMTPRESLKSRSPLTVTTRALPMSEPEMSPLVVET